MTRTVLLLALPLLLAACSRGGLDVSSAEFGEAWPLITETATLSCPAPGQAVATVNRRRYALNQAARDAGFSEIMPVVKLAADPELAALKVKADVAPLVERALTLCSQ
ncbi:MAG: DUF2511 domain-containing protein [Vicinamibacteria bacterium]